PIQPCQRQSWKPQRMLWEKQFIF
ncbi:uncharacterized protein METZ01_LOCUS94391, partial [marine metagenome]